jgi:hypothetical protein
VKHRAGLENLKKRNLKILLAIDSSADHSLTANRQRGQEAVRNLNSSVSG